MKTEILAILHELLFYLYFLLSFSIVLIMISGKFKFRNNFRIYESFIHLIGFFGWGIGLPQAVPKHENPHTDKTHTAVTRLGFEHMIIVSEQLMKMRALDLTATGIG
jgi:uncharacterized membrane protein YsdA (DUF1294 family)